MPSASAHRETEKGAARFGGGGRVVLRARLVGPRLPLRTVGGYPDVGSRRRTVMPRPHPRPHARAKPNGSERRHTETRRERVRPHVSQVLPQTPNRAGRATRRGGCDGGGQGRWRRARCGRGSRAEPCSPEREAVGPSSDPRKGVRPHATREAAERPRSALEANARTGGWRGCVLRARRTHSQQRPRRSLACLKVYALHFVACSSCVVVCYVVSMCVV